MSAAFAPSAYVCLKVAGSMSPVKPSRSPTNKRKCQCSTTSAEQNDFGYLPSGAPRRCCVRTRIHHLCVTHRSLIYDQTHRLRCCTHYSLTHTQGSLEHVVRLLRPRRQGLRRALGALQKARGAPLRSARDRYPLRGASLRAADGRTI